MSQTIPTTLPTMPYPGTTLPWHSQPQGHPSPMDPSPLYFHHHDTLSLHHYLLLSCYLVIPCFIISLILPCTHCPSPGYLVHLSWVFRYTHYLILDITNAPLTCSSVSCLLSLSPGGALLSVVVLHGWVSSSQLWLSLAPILLLT